MSDDKVRIDQVREFIREKGDSPWPGSDENTANILGEAREIGEPMLQSEASRRMFIKTIVCSAVGGAAGLLGVFGWRGMSDETKAALLRRTFEFNERVSQIFYSPKRLAPQFAETSVTIPARVNGGGGLEEEIDLAAWRLNIGGLAGRSNDLIMTIDDIKKLPRTEMTVEFKCIEGWSTIVHWAGVRFSDFLEDCLKKAGIGIPYESKFLVNVSKYVSLSTPDEKYYVGWDMASILHPQTLLAYEMNGEPLKNEHGAPLRLASPMKYGIKQIKRIGRIEFTDERPRDFWGGPEYGYDWYAGH